MKVFPGWQVPRVCSAQPAPAYDWHSGHSSQSHSAFLGLRLLGEQKLGGLLGVVGSSILQVLKGKARGREGLVGG